MESMDQQDLHVVPLDVAEGAEESDHEAKVSPPMMENETARKAFRDLHSSLIERLARYREAFNSTPSLDQFFNDYFRGNDAVESLAGPYVLLYDAMGVEDRAGLEQKIKNLSFEAADKGET